MKNFAKFAIAASLAAALVACGGGSAPEQATTDDATDEAITETVEGEGATLGGWTVSEEATSNLTPEEAEIFQKAVDGLLGVSYEPVSLVGRQIVSGTNYAYLAKTTAVTADAQSEWSIVVAYVDLEGQASVTSVKAIDLSDLHVAEDMDEAVGAWEIVEPGDSAYLPSECQEAFAAAVEAQGIEMVPQALFASQIVSGTNYQVLCIGRLTPDDSYGLYDVIVYRDLDGAAQITEMYALDLAYYVTPEE